MKGIINLSLILIVLLSLCCINNELANESLDVKINDEVLLEEEFLVELNKIDTLGVNEYWSNQIIETATLYVYSPENRLYNGKRISKEIIINDNEMNPFIIDSLTVDLDKDELEKLRRALRTETDNREDIASCFSPHHGIVLRDTLGEILGHISICFECTSYQMCENRVYDLPIGMFREFANRHNLPIHMNHVLKLYRKMKT